MVLLVPSTMELMAETERPIWVKIWLPEIEDWFRAEAATPKPKPWLPELKPQAKPTKEGGGGTLH